MSIRRPTPIRNRVCGLALAVVIGGIVPVAQGQSGRQGLLVQREGDSEPQIAYIAMPDFESLCTPDFVRPDLPIFANELVLSPEQEAAIKRQIEAYLESFKALMADHLPADLRQEPADMMNDGPIDDESKDGAALPPPGGKDGPPAEWGLDELESQLPPGFGVGVQVGVDVSPPEEGQEPGPPQASVSVNIESPPGAELAAEERARLQALADTIAKRITEQVQKQIEQQLDGAGTGGGPLVLGIGGPGGNAENIEEFQAQQDELKAKAEVFQAAKASLRQQFVTEAQTGMAKPQLERWPALERALRRAKLLPKGVLSGERADLIQILTDLELSDAHREAIQEQLEAYAVALDTALAQREAFIPDADAKIDQAIRRQDIDEALSVIDRSASLRVTVRNVNAQFTESVASLLPPAVGEPFKVAVLKESYPRVYGQTYGQRVFEAAKKIDGLDPETLETITAIEAAYRHELADANAHIRQTIDKHQPLESRRGIERLKPAIEGTDTAGGMFAGDDKANGVNPIAKAFSRRAELDQRYAKLVREMLNPAQAAALPEAPVRGPLEPVTIEVGGPVGAPE